MKHPPLEPYGPIVVVTLAGEDGPATADQWHAMRILCGLERPTVIDLRRPERVQSPK